MNATERKILREFREAGWTVIRNAEKVHWHPLYERSVALAHGIDTRERGRRKPFILERGDTAIMIEADHDRYPGQWIVWDNDGDIISSRRDRFDTLLYLRYQTNLCDADAA